MKRVTARDLDLDTTVETPSAYYRAKVYVTGRVDICESCCTYAECECKPRVIATGRYLPSGTLSLPGFTAVDELCIAKEIAEERYRKAGGSRL